MIGFPQNSDYRQVSRAVGDAIHKAFQEPWKAEPQLVANLVWKLPRNINGISLGSGTKISAGGVFVHARPLVTCKTFPATSPRSVEIGDVLFIQTRVSKGKVISRNALLLQAKKASSVPTKPDNPNQWHLYAKWPQFEYMRGSGALAGQRRYIVEPDMYDAAKYMLIGTSPLRSSHSWLHHRLRSNGSCIAQPTQPQISRYRCAHCEITEMIVGNAGKPFSTPKPGKNGWDQVIHDLIIETAAMKSVYIARAGGIGGVTPRGAGVLFFSGVFSTLSVFGSDGQEFVSLDEPPEVSQTWPEEPSENGTGISIIEIILERDVDEQE